MNGHITDLLHGYAHCIDDERYDTWPDFFTEDGLYRITTRESYRANMPIGILECRNKGMMKDRIYSMLNANIYAPHHYRHLLSAPIVVDQIDDTVSVKSSFGLIRIMEGGISELFLSGIYADRIKVGDKGGLLRERIVVLDSSRVDTLIVAPI